MIPAARVLTILDTEYVDGDKMSLHNAFSSVGANELTGGGYAKQTIDWADASGRAKGLAAAVDFSVAAASVVAWIGIWDSTGTTLKAFGANGGSEKTFQVDLANNRIYCEGSGYANDDRVAFTGATVPAGLTEGTLYYVIGVTAGDVDYFQVSTTSGGSAVDITAQPSADARVTKVVPETYAGAGTHRITALSVSL